MKVECLRPSAGTAAWHYSLTFLGGIFWKEREGIVYRKRQRSGDLFLKGNSWKEEGGYFYRQNQTVKGLY